HNMAPGLSDVLGHYPILKTLAEYLSTLDLFHLSLTCRSHHALILAPTQVFDALKRGSLCDGRGLQRRIQHLERRRWMYKWDLFVRTMGDEEIEVYLYTRKCDEAGALPCLRCGINICEQCRECPRVISDYGAQRRPHLNPPWQSENVMCLCESCDAKMNETLRGKFLSDTCDCDVYKRWICSGCATAEKKQTKLYYSKHTKTVEGTDDWAELMEIVFDETKSMQDHQFERWFFCTCGSRINDDTVPRCTWCKRKHRPEEEWSAEMREMERDIPSYVDNDGCYPIWGRDYQGENTPQGYPRLKYNGPIYNVTAQSRGGSGQQPSLRSLDAQQGPVTISE
ncbi:hypothetical protein B0I35DRAFT_347608, partial [Stachybotrys elegans]